MTFDPAVHHRRSIRLQSYDYGQPGAYFVTICTSGRKCILGNVVEGVVELSPFGRIVAETWFNLPSHYPGLELDAFIVMPNHVHGIIVLTVDIVGAGLKPAPTPPLHFATDLPGFEPGTVHQPVPNAPRAGSHTVGAGFKPAPAPPLHFATDLSAFEPGIVHQPVPNAPRAGSHTVGAGFKPAPAPNAHQFAPNAPALEPGRLAAPPTRLPEIVRGFKTFSARGINEWRGSRGKAVWQRNYYEHIIRSDRALNAIRSYIAENPMRWAYDPENPHRITSRLR